MDIAELVRKRWDTRVAQMNIPLETGDSVRKFDFFSLQGKRGKGVATISTGVIDGEKRHHLHATYEYHAHHLLGTEKLQAYLVDDQIKSVYLYCKGCENLFTPYQWHENGCSSCLAQYAHLP